MSVFYYAKNSFCADGKRAVDYRVYQRILFSRYFTEDTEVLDTVKYRVCVPRDGGNTTTVKRQTVSR